MLGTGVVRWLTVGLHAIVLVFSLFVGATLIDGDLDNVIKLADTDPRMKQVMVCSVFLISGNLLAILLICSPLFRRLAGVCVLLGYETLFLAGSLVLLSRDYSVVFGVIILMLIYVAGVRWFNARQQT